MPELPEVETIRIGLQKLIVGKTIKSIKNDWPKSFPNDKYSVNNFLINKTITQVRRRAKVLMIDLNSNHSLVIHLKMTGQMVFVDNPRTRGEKNREPELRLDNPSSKTSKNDKLLESKRWGAGHPNDSLIGRLPDKSTRVEIAFTDNSVLFFNDQRKFGWMRLMPTIEVENIDFMKKVGPEPLESAFTEKVLIMQLAKRKNSNIKAALLDQTVIAGIGNIYADESLFLAGIHPASRVGAIPKSRINKLHRSIIDVLELSLQKGGSTDRNYISAEGKRGSYIKFAKVFRREKQPCPVCGKEIIKIRHAGRGTHLCNKCQRLYE